MTDEEWREIPGFEGWYEVSSCGRVRSVKRIVVRSNGRRYTVKERIRRISIDKRNGFRYVTLATGKRGRYHTAYLHLLVDPALVWK
ncbi:NUMOD4 domain-containing protein [Mycobacterium sp.]|uniref:NUMOD4 domain-containing protein n=1 Tax=Mycobacterium sp. TaxID=1785 RepID=UPI003BB09882